MELVREKVQSDPKEINRAIRSHSGRKSVNIVSLEGNHQIAVGIDKPVKIRIDKGPAGDFLGALNAGALITLNGSTGRFVGSTMNEGEIIVNGDAGDGVGTYLHGGLVVIKGDALGSVGGGMRGGTVLIDGNVHGPVGGSMHGGVIIITGDVEGEIGRGMTDGAIIVAGKSDKLTDQVKVRSVVDLELGRIKAFHKRFRFKRFQSLEALKEFRTIEKV